MLLSQAWQPIDDDKVNTAVLDLVERTWECPVFMYERVRRENERDAKDERGEMGEWDNRVKRVEWDERDEKIQEWRMR